MSKKKCSKCGVPLEGVLAKVASVFGISPSERNPNICNKCDEEDNKKEEESNLKNKFHSDEFSEEHIEENQERKEEYSESGD